jgi:hypothetical protein
MASEDDRIRSQVGVRGAVERRAFRVALSVSRRRGLRRGRGPGRQGARKRIIGCGAVRGLGQIRHPNRRLQPPRLGPLARGSCVHVEVGIQRLVWFIWDVLWCIICRIY